MELNVWRKSSRSGSNGQCTEVMNAGSAILVRDTKARSGPTLSFTPSEWTAFLEGVREGEFDIRS